MFAVAEVPGKIERGYVRWASFPNRPVAHFLKHLFTPGVVKKNLPQNNFLAQTRVQGKAAPQVPGTAGPVPFYDPKAAAMRPIKPGLNETQLKQVVTANPHLEGMARDWRGMLDLKREIAYTFRGDSRDPTALKTQFNGFQPSTARTDNDFMYGPVFETFADYLKRAYARKIIPSGA